MGFQVGDRVVLIVDRPDANESMHPGLCGTVTLALDLDDETQRIGVEWDLYVDGHTCDDTCESGHGWFVNSTDVMPECETDETEVADFAELLEFIGFLS